jgi:hypothetical protein
MTPPRPRESLALAERAHGLVQSRPREACDLAERALRLARRDRDAEARVAALHALGYARYALGDERALATVRAAVRAGTRSGFDHRAALARRTLAVYLAYRGRTHAALREIEAARDGLRGLERARTEVHRIAVYGLAGRAAEALPSSSAALGVLRRHRDAIWEARLRYNRAAALNELGDHRAAERDLERARVLYATLGLDAAVADARVELARALLAASDPLGCLAELDAVDVEQQTDWAAAWLHLLRAEASLALGLLPEARAGLRRFEERVGRAGADDAVNTARVQVATLALAAADLDTAASLAASARRSYAARGQVVPAAATALVELGVAAARRAPSSYDLTRGLRAADRLENAGRGLDALRVRLVVARLACLRNSSRTAVRELGAAAGLARIGTLADRVALRHVEALVRRGGGDAAGARRALREGLALLDRRRSGLGSIELRAAVSRLGEELAVTGLSLALESGRPAHVLEWAERLRANALRTPAVPQAPPPELRAQQAELRRLDRRRAQADAAHARLLADRRTRLEGAIRSSLLLMRGNVEVRRPADAKVAARALGARTLVEYVQLDGRLAALVCARGSWHVCELDGAGVPAELDGLRAELRRLAGGRLGGGDRLVVEAAAAALDRALVRPVADHLSASVVFVPTGPLHAVPWSALPSLRGRSLVVAPSLSTWVALSAAARRRSGGTVLVAGPRLRHAVHEVADLAVLHPGATVLVRRDATANAVLAALEGASLAHVACHGRFRADSPLFSALELADGPLTALDLHALRRPPELLVLSACELGLSERQPGDELLGLAAALLGLGTRTIVASVVPVPDGAARRLMVAFHRRLRTTSPATALAGAQAELAAVSPALAGFVCLGAG